MLRAIASLAALALATTGVSAGEAPEAKAFRAGAAAVDITPKKLPVIVNGGFLEGKSDVVTDPLFARSLVLDDGAMRIALTVVDSCVVPQQILDAAKAQASAATGIPVQRMMISATHCHSAPSVFGGLGSGVDQDYEAYLPGKIAEAIVAANANLVPARIGWAVGRDPKNVFCRRFLMKPGTAPTNPFSGASNDRAQMNPGHENPNAVSRTGPVDESVTVLAVQTREGRPLCILGNYSTHYAGAPGISADYFGVFCRRIGELAGVGQGVPGFVGIMSNGTSGDANCLDFVHPPRKFDRFTVGEDVAQAAFAAYKTIQFQDHVTLAAAQKSIRLAIRMPTPEEVAKAKEFLANVPGGKPRNIPEVYAQETVLLSQTPPARDVLLQAFRVGNFGIAAFPLEVFGSTGLEVKRRSPVKTTMNVELANAYHGYLPPPDQFPLGGYTTWRARSSCLETGAEPKIVGAMLDLLSETAPR